jgi:hypothetical protein
MSDAAGAASIAATAQVNWANDRSVSLSQIRWLSEYHWIAAVCSTRHPIVLIAMVDHLIANLQRFTLSPMSPKQSPDASKNPAIWNSAPCASNG